jgi:hypothetical protein
MTPNWIFDVLAAVMLAVAVVSAARLVAAWPWRRDPVTVDTDGAHLLMAIAMAGMLVPSLQTVSGTGWEVVFGVLTAWFALRVVLDARANGVRALVGGCGAPHLVHSAAMLYMFLATTPAAGMAGMAGMNELPGSSGSTMLTLENPTLAFAFALILIGYSVWDLDQLSGRRHRLASARVSLAGMGAASIPAMAGVESMTTVPSSSRPAGDAADTGAADDQAAPSGRTGDDAIGEILLSPAVKVGCRVAMGVVMVFIMLIAI